MKKINKIIFLVVLITFSLLSCNNLNYKINLTENETNISCNFNKLRLQKINNDEHTYIFGDILIQNNSDKNIEIDLDSIAVIVNDTLQGHFDFDCIVTMLHKQEISSKSQNGFAVYWVFNKLITTNDIKSIALVFRKSSKKILL
jgi:hypothetical protein